jgi:tripartite-type tricarboxylate transporter receptor subunit TctC
MFSGCECYSVYFILFRTDQMKLRSLLSAIALSMITCAAHADAWPAKPIKITVAVPGGYTILASFNGPLAFTRFLTKLPYDPQKDLASVILARGSKKMV